jgi:hypothetical protein
LDQPHVQLRFGRSQQRWFALPEKRRAGFGLRGGFWTALVADSGHALLLEIASDIFAGDGQLDGTRMQLVSPFFRLCALAVQAALPLQHHNAPSLPLQLSKSAWCDISPIFRQGCA